MFHAVPFQCSMRLPSSVVTSVSVVTPTAQAFFAEVTATPVSWDPDGRLGVGEKAVQAEPLKRSMSWKVGVNMPPSAAVNPTAHEAADVAATEASTLIGAGVALGTVVHEVPSQRSASVLSPVETETPAASALVGEMAATEDSAVPPPEPGATDHAVPFQCSASAVTDPNGPVSPTADASVAEVAVTPSSSVSDGKLGAVVATVQDVPSQRSIT